MPKLAINGGTPVRNQLFPSQNTIGPLEIEAANRVLSSGKLTGYQGSWGPNFYGGKEIRALEEEWAQKFGVKHAIACNSATSGLFIACGSCGMDQADAGDAIVTPFSMTCSATAPMGWKHGVRFGDVERDYYCLSADSVREHLISNMLTKFSAVIPVSLFGQPYDAVAYRKLLDEYSKLTGRRVYIIEDAAQAVGAMLYDKQDIGHYAGTLGDIGVYSFNLGKHLTAGEGGMIVTNDDELAMKCRLLMNHAEAVVNSMNDQHDKADESGWIKSLDALKSLYGFNLRLSEVHASIIRVQLQKMDYMIKQRVDNIAYLVNKLKTIPCLEMPKIREGCTHTYYVCPLRFNSNKLDGIYRDKFVAAVKSELQPVKDRENEGVTISGGYIRPIQNMPLFGRSLDETPECRRQWQEELIVLHRMFGPAASRRDLDDIYNAFEKVWKNREELL